MGRVEVLRALSFALCAVVSVSLAAKPAAAQDTEAFEAEVLVLVNKERQANGLAPLTRAVELDRAAGKFAQYMGEAGFFSHNGPDGSTPSSRIKAEGYNGTTWGENIAAGQRTPAAVMNAWMNSDGHRANILSSSFKEIGIGCASVSGSPMGIYWVQNFGARKNMPAPAPAPGTPTTPAPAPAKPAISGINPASGKVGDTVAVDGSAFGSTAGKVLFGGGVAGAIQGWSDTKISVKVPTGAKSGAVTVQNSVGTSNGFNFTVTATQPEQPTPPPTTNPTPTPTPDPGASPPSPPTNRRTRPRMTSITPGSGRSGVLVTIKGQKFGATAGRVIFGSTGGAAVQSWTDTEIKVVLTGSPGRRLLLLVRSDGMPSTNMARFAINP